MFDVPGDWMVGCLVIFGWGQRTTRYHGVAFVDECPGCRRERPWQLVTFRWWFTLFFVPVFPYRSVTVVMCPECGTSYEVPKDRERWLREVAKSDRQ